MAPRLSSVLVMVSSINWAIWGDIDAGSMDLIALFISPPAMPMAPPTLLSSFLILVLSKMYLGKAVRIRETWVRAKTLFTKIWLGIRPVIMAWP